MALKLQADSTPASRPSWVRRWAANLFLVIAATLVALLLGEAGMRLRSGGNERPLEGLFHADPELGASLTPGFVGVKTSSEYEYDVRINDHGVRDHPITPKPPGVRRLLALGDSFTFGTGVTLESTYPKRLEQALNAAQASHRFEVINAGVPSYGPLQEAHILRRLIGPVAPDGVVLGFFVGNDFTDDYRRLSPEESRKTPRGFLQRHSVLFRFMERYATLPWRRWSYDIHHREPSPDTVALIDKTFAYVLDIRQICEQYGIDLLVMIIPRYTQVYEDAWNKAVTVFRLSPEAYDLEEPNRRLSAMLRDENIRTLDLLAPMRREVRSRSLHFEQDRHWNREGNQFVASMVADVVLKEMHLGASTR